MTNPDKNKGTDKPRASGTEVSAFGGTKTSSSSSSRNTQLLDLLPDSKQYFGDITYDPALGCDKFLPSGSISISVQGYSSLSDQIKSIIPFLLDFMVLGNKFTQPTEILQPVEFCNLNVNALNIKIYIEIIKLYHIFRDQEKTEKAQKYPLPDNYKLKEDIKYQCQIKRNDVQYCVYDFLRSKPSESSSGSQRSQQTNQNSREIKFEHNFLEEFKADDRPKFDSATSKYLETLKEKPMVFQTWCHMRSRDAKSTENNTDTIGENVFIGSHYCNKYQGAIESAINHYAYLKRTQYGKDQKYPSSIYVVIMPQLIEKTCVLDRIVYTIYLDSMSQIKVCEFEIPGQLDSFSEIEARCVYAQVYLALCPKVFLKEVLFEGALNLFENFVSIQS